MRHAFALAFDLALRRDPLHSLVVPLLLRAPWMVAFAFLVRRDDLETSATSSLLAAFALLGQSMMWWAVDSMLRFRARSVFNTPADARPAPIAECYAKGLARLPWLYVTEFVRNVGLTFGFGFFLVPGIFLSYRLAFSTEAVVLDDPHLTAAFRRSFHLSQGRFERWLEMIAASGSLALATLFLTVVLFIIFGPSDAWWAWLLAGSVLAAAFWPIIQYAWTFMYLRLREVEELPDGAVAATHARSEPAAPSVPGAQPMVDRSSQSVAI